MQSIIIGSLDLLGAGMSDFERIRPVIAYYEDLSRKKFGNSFVAQAQLQFADMQRKYYSSIENPDYSQDIKKFCYLYKYSVPHGYYIYRVLRDLRPKIRPSIFSRNPTRIACVGGGPGTEIIGLCRYFREMEPENLSNPVEITVFDKEPTWRDACERVLASVSPGLALSLHFVEFDATNPQTYAHLDFSGFHLVMANFFASEIRKARIIAKSRQFWAHMFGSMGAGKIFVAVDFADQQGRGWQYINNIVPDSATTVLSNEELVMVCPDSKACILELEAELDHRPKKRAQNFILAGIT